MIQKSKGGRPQKLTEAQWEEIRTRATAGESMNSLAKEFGVDRALVSRRVSHTVKIVKTLVSQVSSLPVSQQRDLFSQVEVENYRKRIGDNTLAGAAHLSGMFRERVSTLDAQATVDEMKDAAGMISIIKEAAPGALQVAPSAKEGATPTADAKERLKRMLGL